MTRDIEQLNEEITLLKKQNDRPTRTSSGVGGYSVLMTILTDLLGCIFIGYVIGLFLQKVLHTGPMVTAGLTLLGGVAGLYTTVCFALRQEKKKR